MTMIQVSLTVEESKRLIAMAISTHPKVKKTLNQGSILFKGGSTVSEVSKAITGHSLSLCGIITNRGTVMNVESNELPPHIGLYRKGKFEDIDDSFDEEVLSLTENDLVVCGANAIDCYGNAAMLTGVSGGGGVSSAFSIWHGEGVAIIIPVGLEKLIPNNINDIIKNTGRRKKKLSTGMSVGLMPIRGEIITEIEAIDILTGLKAIPIASGGIGTAKGSITLDIEGEQTRLKDFMDMVLEIKNDVSNYKEEFKECKPPCEYCKEHLGCVYKKIRP